MDKKVGKLNSGREILSLIFLKKIKYESQLSCLSHFIAVVEHQRHQRHCFLHRLPQTVLV